MCVHQLPICFFILMFSSGHRIVAWHHNNVSFRLFLCHAFYLRLYLKIRRGRGVLVRLETFETFAGGRCMDTFIIIIMIIVIRMFIM